MKNAQDVESDAPLIEAVNTGDSDGTVPTACPDPSAAIAPTAAVGPVVCKCGQPRHATKPGICAHGHTWRGQSSPALVTNEHSAVFAAAHDAVRREIVAAVVSDGGHTVNDAPYALLASAESIAQASLIRDAAYERMTKGGGPLSPSSKPRRAFAVWVAAVDRLEKHLRLVGLRRVPRPARSLAEALAAEPEADRV